jgi:hypothetical protein
VRSRRDARSNGGHRSRTRSYSRSRSRSPSRPRRYQSRSPSRDRYGRGSYRGRSYTRSPSPARRSSKVSLVSVPVVVGIVPCARLTVYYADCRREIDQEREREPSTGDIRRLWRD